MRNLLIIIALCYSHVISAQNSKDTFATVKLAPLTSRSIDPVCRMRLRYGVVDSVDFNGVRYGFCAPSCKHKFLEQPKAFVKK